MSLLCRCCGYVSARKPKVVMVDFFQSTCSDVQIMPILVGSMLLGISEHTTFLCKIQIFKKEVKSKAL